MLKYVTIDKDSLKEFFSEAFDEGCSSYQELKEEVIERLIDKCNKLSEENKVNWAPSQTQSSVIVTGHSIEEDADVEILAGTTFGHTFVYSDIVNDESLEYESRFPSGFPVSIRLDANTQNNAEF